MCAAFGGVRRKIITRVSDISGTFIFFVQKAFPAPLMVRHSIVLASLASGYWWVRVPWLRH